MHRAWISNFCRISMRQKFVLKGNGPRKKFYQIHKSKNGINSENEFENQKSLKKRVQYEKSPKIQNFPEAYLLENFILRNRFLPCQSYCSAPSMSPAFFSAYTYAPIVSVKVKRSFLEYKAVLSDRRILPPKISKSISLYNTTLNSCEYFRL